MSSGCSSGCTRSSFVECMVPNPAFGTIKKINILCSLISYSNWLLITWSASDAIYVKDKSVNHQTDSALLHVVPVGDDAALDWVVEREDTAFALRLVAYIAILLTSARLRALLARVADSRRKLWTGHVIASEAALHMRLPLSITIAAISTGDAISASSSTSWLEVDSRRGERPFALTVDFRSSERHLTPFTISVDYESCERPFILAADDLEGGGRPWEGGGLPSTLRVDLEGAKRPSTLTVDWRGCKGFFILTDNGEGREDSFNVTVDWRGCDCPSFTPAVSANWTFYYSVVRVGWMYKVHINDNISFALQSYFYT